MPSVLTKEYVTKTEGADPTIHVSRLKNFPTDAEAEVAFKSITECYELMCPPEDVSNNGDLFLAKMDDGKSVFIELKTGD